MAEKNNKGTDMTRDLLLQEVDEEMRAERLRQWWQRFGSWLVGAAVVIILVTVSYELWQMRQRAAGEEATALLLEADRLARDGSHAEAVALLERVEKDRNGIAAVATLRLANLQAEEGNTEQAEALYRQLAESGGNEAMVNFAHLKLGNYDAIRPQTPFYATAQELKANELYTQGKTEEARQIIEALLSAPDLPASLQARLGELAQAYR